MADSIPSDLGDEEFTQRMEYVFADQFDRDDPTAGGARSARCGVRLENVARDGSQVDLLLTFRAGELYCCSQLRCHGDVQESEFWAGLRQGMDAYGLTQRPLPSIRIARVVVEEGALFDPGGLRNPPLRSLGYSYEDGPFPPVGGEYPSTAN